MKIHVLYHVHYERAGFIADWVREKGHSLKESHLYKKDELPSPGEIDMLVIMGGPMNVYDDDLCPWLPLEKKFIRQTVITGKPVLGICLGAQLLATALNSRVYQNRVREIGWFPVYLGNDSPWHMNAGLPDKIMTFHWHRDTFELPAGAERLATSDATLNQAFLYGDRILGIQFHPEIKLQNIRQLIRSTKEDLLKSAYVQSADEMLGLKDHFDANHKLLGFWLDKLENRINKT